LARGFAEECRDLSGICEQHVRELIERLDDVETREELSLLVEDTFDLLEESRSGVVRVQDIVQNLKCFARLDEAEFKVASIHEIIESTLKVVWNELKYKCEVDKRFGEVPPTLCNPGQLNQVFMNLLINAAQAIEERGHVVIATDVFEEKIRCRISDDGIGIPEEHLKDLFTPFFTTKPVGMGTGLGLSISYGIIKDHGGSIDVQSEVGKGTTFTILLPIQHAETSR
jgi:signal transduction histidine kinase